MMKILSCLLAIGWISNCFGQAPASGPNPVGPSKAQLAAQEKAAMAARQLALRREAQINASINEVNRDGLEVPISSIAHYRGAHSFQISGIGLVVGLENTGDSKKSIITQTLYANYFKSRGLTVNSTLVNALNVALVQVDANMPAFTKPGTKIDVTVSSISDAKSLQGGMLVMTPLYSPTDPENVIVTAQGALSIGGFNVSASGSSVQRNHVNIGRVPAGGEVQARIDSKVVFNDGDSRKLYLDLEQADPTMMSRLVQKLNERYPDLQTTAVDNTTAAITIPAGEDPSDVMSKVNQTTIFAVIPATVVINERTGTIVVGGNVRLGPAMIVSGSLNVRIDTENTVSQPAPFSQGTTTQVSNSGIAAGQETAKIAVLPPISTLSQLARIFQALELKPNDVIQILQALKQQGALKARIELQ